MATIPTLVQQDILAEINRVNGTSLTTDFVDVVNIRPTTDATLNTAVTVTAKLIAGNPYKGTNTFRYHRIDIGSLTNVISFLIPPMPLSRYGDALNAINRITKLDLRLEDINDGVISLAGQVGDTFTLTCSDSSPKYTGKALFTMGLTASFLMTGNISVTRDTTYRVYPNTTTGPFQDNVFYTMIIGGVEYPIDTNGNFTVTAASGVYPFVFTSPYAVPIGTTLPITKLTRAVNFNASFGLLFTNNRTLVEIGDNVFAGQQSPVSLNAAFSGCTALATVGTGFCDFPGGFSDLGGAFNGCTGLTSIGETEPPANGHSAVEASSMFYNCNMLSDIPPKFFWKMNKISTARRLLYGVGNKSGKNLVITKDAFKDFSSCIAIDDLFTSSSLVDVPAGLFDQMPLLNQAQQVFYTTNISSVPDRLFRLNTKLTSIVRCFSGIKQPLTVGKEIFPEVALNADSVFRATPIADIDIDVFNGTKLTGIASTFYSCVFQKDLPNIFHDQTAITTANSTFFNATLPSLVGNNTLFKDCGALTDITTLFYGARISGGVIPPDLFANNPNITTASQAFRGVTGVGTTLNIPAGIFRNNGLIKDMSFMFTGATNVSFSGPVLPNSKSVTNINNMFYGSSATELPADLLINGDNVVTATQLFGALPITTLPDGILSSFGNLETFNYGFFNSNKLLTVPADLLKYSPKLKDISYLFNGATGLTAIPDGFFDNNALLTNISNFAKSCASLYIPKGLFKNSTEIVNCASAFDSAGLRGYLDNMFNPALVAKAPNMQGFMSTCRLSSIAKPTAPWNIPLTGITQGCFAYSSNMSYTDEEFLAALGVSDTNKLITTVSLVTNFVGSCNWIYGTRDRMTMGLWQVSDPTTIPSNTITSVMGSALNIK